MDFEIEDDDPYNFESNWSKPSKTGYFGFNGGENHGEDIYDYDFGNNLDEETHYTSSSSPTHTINSKKKKTETQSLQNNQMKASKASKASPSYDNALERAQNMLSKYSSKGPAKKAPSVKKYQETDFDEDDISLNSDDMSGDGFPESPGGLGTDTVYKPRLSKDSIKSKKTQLKDQEEEVLQRGFDLENDDDDDLNIDDGIEHVTTGPSLYGELAPESSRMGHGHNESIVEGDDDDDDYSKDNFDDSVSQDLGGHGGGLVRGSSVLSESGVVEEPDIEDVPESAEEDVGHSQPKIFHFSDLLAVAGDDGEQPADEAGESLEESVAYGMSFDAEDDEPKDVTARSEAPHDPVTQPPMVNAVDTAALHLGKSDAAPPAKPAVVESPTALPDKVSVAKVPVTEKQPVSQSDPAVQQPLRALNNAAPVVVPQLESQPSHTSTSSTSAGKANEKENFRVKVAWEPEKAAVAPTEHTPSNLSQQPSHTTTIPQASTYQPSIHTQPPSETRSFLPQGMPTSDRPSHQPQSFSHMSVPSQASASCEVPLQAYGQPPQQYQQTQQHPPWHPDPAHPPPNGQPNSHGVPYGTQQPPPLPSYYQQPPFPQYPHQYQQQYPPVPYPMYSSYPPPHYPPQAPGYPYPYPYPPSGTTNATYPFAPARNSLDMSRIFRGTMDSMAGGESPNDTIAMKEILKELQAAKEEAAYATKKLADVILEMHRSKETKESAKVDNIARKSPRSKSPKVPKKSRERSVSFDESEEYEDDDEFYSHDDFEEESCIHSSTPQKPVRRPSHQQKEKVNSPRRERTATEGEGAPTANPINSEEGSLHPPRASERESIDFDWVSKAGHGERHVRYPPSESYLRDGSSSVGSLAARRDTFDSVLMASQSLFRRQLSSLRDKLDIMNYTTGDLNSRLSGGYEGRRSWLPSDRTGARTHRDITRSLPEFNESRTQERFDAKNKLRATLLQVDPTLSEDDVSALMARYS